MERFQCEIPVVFCEFKNQSSQDRCIRTIIRDTYRVYKKLIENITPSLIRDHKYLYENIVGFLNNEFKETSRYQVIKKFIEIIV